MIPVGDCGPLICQAVVPGFAFSAMTQGASTPAGPAKLAVPTVVDVEFGAAVPKGEWVGAETDFDEVARVPDELATAAMTAITAAAATTPSTVLARKRRLSAAPPVPPARPSLRRPERVWAGRCFGTW